jgi:hypothetical protein
LPYATTQATARYTASQPTWKRLPTSFQVITFAQLARKIMNTVVIGLLPCAHGTRSTTMCWHSGQDTRRIAYSSNTGIPYSCTIWKVRGGSRS